MGKIESNYCLNNSVSA